MMETDGSIKREKPTHSWLRDHGRPRSSTPCGEYPRQGPSPEFWRTDLEAEAVESGYDWATDHERTIEALESFLTSRRKRKGLADSSIDTLRYRLNRYVAAYCEENGTDDLVTPVAREGDVPAKAVDACWAAFDRLHVDLDGGQTKRRIHLAVSNWYAHLVRRKWAAVNPADGLDDEFGGRTAMTTIRIHHVSPPSTFAHSTMRQTTRRTASWYSPLCMGSSSE